MKIRYLGMGLALVGMLVSTSFLSRLPRKIAAEDIVAAISPPVQVALALGDRYLAANWNTLRVTVLGVTDIPAESLPVLAKVQEDIAFLNPCQEDNYYQAQAFLPWSGQMPAAKVVLEAAAKCRSWDVMPSFFLGFNSYYFSGNYQEAGNWFNDASLRVQGMQRDQLQFIAAKFYEKQENPRLAIKVIENLIANTRNEQLKQYLNARIIRLEGLVALRDAATLYAKKSGHKLTALNELISAGLVRELPHDPFGAGYSVDDKGNPVLNPMKK